MKILKQYSYPVFAGQKGIENKKRKTGKQYS